MFQNLFYRCDTTRQCNRQMDVQCTTA